MSVKLIAVDMDSTFLKTDKSYNKARFLKQYAQLKQRGIHFVVASGNPLYTLQQYFPEIGHEIAYVAENGSHVMHRQQELNFSSFNRELLQHIIDDLIEDFADCMILCAKDRGYIGAELPESSLTKLNIYFKNLQRVEQLSTVQTPVCKLTLNTTPNSEPKALQLLATKSYVQQKQVDIVSSGFGFIDLILPNQHKAFGLSFLQRLWDVADHEMLTIGDNYNDLAMVQQAGYGFAMENAVAELKQVAKHHTRSNDQEGVLDVIDWVLSDTEQWEQWQQKQCSVV
ncbi:Cof-type HAD-IIB family hydrolase [Acinetobacter rudis]|uniref:Cof-like hydrolase n=1 Tax=Acinetobacter rudis CIP 110305 TaxID=421052 RepID=S3N9G6_9GAMM|nr:Cof-type HAD-IIB family hydrolase [Acinetobacter rudis]EPF70984.1 hypothetical protein F945_02747 [Acinetobacter rudis CIP 110305]